MKCNIALILSALVPVSASFRLQSISYQALLKGIHVDDAVDEDTSTSWASFSKALSETGIVSIRGIPDMNHKKKVLSTLHKCALESKATQEHTFPDGTRRLTMATHSIPGGVQNIDHKSSSSQDCKSFDESSKHFRATVEIATNAFAHLLGRLFGLDKSLEEPLLSTVDDFGFMTFSDVVDSGEHLEHFHSYQKAHHDDSNNGQEETIEMHVDQGLFIAFTPGCLVALNEDASVKFEMSSGFFVQLDDGSIEEVEFSEEDDLVFMLGDGVNQYINKRLNGSKLRAVPHALFMNSHSESVSRVWYGRMVLPPVDAVHPLHGMTFGELRETMISSSLKNQEYENAGIGCSDAMVPRDLSAITCEDDSIYCWHRCMSLADFDVSHENCAEQGLAVHCINPRLQLWAGDLHGDYYPACADNTTQEVETPFPVLADFPRSEEVCTEKAFLEFADPEGYDFHHELPNGAQFMWSIVNNEVKGRIAFNGLFGWLSFGFAGNLTMKNGMHSAYVLLALPGGNYTGFSGLDLDLPPNIQEYQIHSTQTPFRYWQEPLPSVATRAVDTNGADDGIEFTECFTAMSFQRASIGKDTFNLTGKDEMLWAANGENSYVQYHGPKNRGRFAIVWKTGEVTFAGQALPPQESKSSMRSLVFAIAIAAVTAIVVA